MRALGRALWVGVGLSGCATVGPPLDPAEDLLRLRRDPAATATTSTGPDAATATAIDPRNTPMATYRCGAPGDARDTWDQRVTEGARCPHCEGRCVPRLVRVQLPPATEVATPDVGAGR